MSEKRELCYTSVGAYKDPVDCLALLFWRERLERRNEGDRSSNVFINLSKSIKHFVPPTSPYKTTNLLLQQVQKFGRFCGCKGFL